MKIISTVFLLLMLGISSVCAQTTTRKVEPWEVQELKTKSTAMIATGSVLLAGAIPTLTFASLYLQKVDEYNTSHKANGREGPGAVGKGISLFVAGAAMGVGGAALIGAGLMVRKDFKLKEKQLSLGYLDDGTIGLNLRF